MQNYTYYSNQPKQIAVKRFLVDKHYTLYRFFTYSEMTSNK